MHQSTPFKNKPAKLCYNKFMNIGEIQNNIETISDSDKKRLLVTNYLTSCLPILTDSKDYLDAVIYNIAGLASTEYIQSLAEDDEINDIITIAGEMEVPADNNQDNLDLLINLIKNLGKPKTTE